MAWYILVSFLCGIPVGLILGYRLKQLFIANTFPCEQAAILDETSTNPVQANTFEADGEIKDTPSGSEIPGLSQLLDIIELQIGSLISESEQVFSSILNSIEQLQERVRQSLSKAQELGRKIYSSEAGSTGGIVGQSIMELMSFSRETEAALQQVVDRLTISRDNCRIIAGKAEKELQDFIQEISGIAYKTKILALNASIAAAHAGQYGRDFEVIAREVRRLADMAYEATMRVNRIAEGIASSVKELSTELQDYLEEIQDDKQQIDAAIKKAGEDITSAAREIERLISNLVAEIGGFFQDIEGTIVAGQFQDISKQRLQHILEVLRDLGNILRLETETNNVISKDKLSETIANLMNKYTTYVERENHFTALGMQYSESPGNNIELF